MYVTKEKAKKIIKQNKQRFADFQKLPPEMQENIFGLMTACTRGYFAIEMITRLDGQPKELVLKTINTKLYNDLAKVIGCVIETIQKTPFCYGTEDYVTGEKYERVL